MRCGTKLVPIFEAWRLIYLRQAYLLLGLGGAPTVGHKPSLGYLSKLIIYQIFVGNTFDPSESEVS